MRDDPSFRLEVDADVYSTSVVNRTCYALAAEASFQVTTAQGQHSILVSGVCEEDHQKLRNEFFQSLVDFSVREDIEKKTADIRALIWQTAFAEANPRA